MSLAITALTSIGGRQVCLDDGARALTGCEAVAAIDSDATMLRRAGVRVVALAAGNGIGWAIADLALTLAGVPTVPIPGYFTATQVGHAVASSATDAVLTDQPERWQVQFPTLTRSGVRLRCGLTLLIRPVDEHAVSSAALPAGTAKITYTSGSTGTPKGVCLSQSALDSVVASVTQATDSLDLDRHLCALPLATLLENIAGLHAALASGATCLLPPAGVTGMSGTSLDAGAYLRAIARFTPSSLMLVPQMLLALVTACDKGWKAPSSLKFIAVGGARTGSGLLERAAAYGLPVCEGYGLSECASVVALNVPAAMRAGTVGRVLPHAQVNIAADGEIIVRGSVLSGYVGSAPTAHGEFATGDLGRLDADGYLTVTGRKKNLFVTAFGRNVSPEWVECELLAAGISQALVFGEARPYNVALIGASAVRDSDLSGIVATANRRLPAYAQIQKWEVLPEPFTFENAMLTSNGRLRRDVIVRRCRERIDSLYDADLVAI